MRVQEHIGKISWTFADKLLFLIYGFVTLLQIKQLDPVEFGLSQLLLNLHNWLFNISDSFALHNIIQFGAVKEDRGKVNTIALVLHVALVMGSALAVYLFSSVAANILGQPRFVEIAMLLPVLCLLNIPRTFSLKLIVREFRFNLLFFSNLAYFGTMTVLTFYYITTKTNLYFEDIINIYIAGSVVSSALTVILAYRFMSFKLQGEIRFKTLMSFGLPLTLQSSMHAFPKQLDIYLVQFFFSTAVVGIYSSAKSLFRVFDEAGQASYTLMYPAAVKHIKMGNRSELNDLITKAVSFMFVAFLAAIFLLEAGLAEMFIKWFLPVKYYDAIGMFNLMILAGLFIPMSMSIIIIMASGKPQNSLKIVTISVAMCFVAFLIAGFMNNPSLLPLGIIAYNAGLGIFGMLYVKKHWGFPVRQLFRAFSDTFGFLSKITGKYRRKI